MIISGSFWRKIVVTVAAAVVFVSLYEVTILDSRYAARLTRRHDTSALPSPGVPLTFSATAYCQGFVTASGVAARNGIAAADPELLPIGSVVQIGSISPRYDGIYTILDTGSSVQGRIVDLYMWNCNEAREFGRKSIRLTVLRLGWNPRATTPGFMDRFFRKPEPAPLPASPLPSSPLPSSPLPLVLPPGGMESRSR
jgi:3D (Asp-Asp-Asp) domain-containing protein